MIMPSRSESCIGILLRNHIVEPTLVICHNVNGGHQLGCDLSSLLYNHCALFFFFTTISNLLGRYFKTMQMSCCLSIDET